MEKFDLNIEQILENWEPYHAIREFLANAIDEQILTGTKDIEVFKKGKAWHIRDFGRGLRYLHLTQNENQEKLQNSNIIGKFGIGLKDALATFDRHNIKVTIHSQFSIISTEMLPKERFADIFTLHAILHPAKDKGFVGTEVIIEGISDSDMEKARKLFLRFSDEEILETTRYGQVVLKSGDSGSIYINGVKVAEETNFLFSYNITYRNAAIRKSLNRERTNVGRTAYADIVKKILLICKSQNVAGVLSEDIQKLISGTNSDELNWIDVQKHAVKLLSATGNYLFVSAEQREDHPDMIDEALSNGITIIHVPQALRDRINGSIDIAGNPVRDIALFMEEYIDSFVFEFIDPAKLTAREKLVYNFTANILDLIGGKPRQVQHIKISRSMRKSLLLSDEPLGIWDESSRSIIIHRGALKSLNMYAGVLIHEAIHARYDLDDMSRDFEYRLTATIGDLCKYALRNDKPKGKLK